MQRKIKKCLEPSKDENTTYSILWNTVLQSKFTALNCLYWYKECFQNNNLSFPPWETRKRRERKKKSEIQEKKKNTDKSINQ